MLLFCGMLDLIFKNDSTLLLKALQNGRELFLEVAVPEFSGCSPCCEGDCSIGLYEGFGVWSLLEEPLPPVCLLWEGV